jgi:hypothetical protein
MFIPIVKRSITVNVTNVFDFPFRCASCGLATTAHVSAAGEGSARSAYVAPNEHAARQRAGWVGSIGLVLVLIASVGACAHGVTSAVDPMKEAFVGGLAALIGGLVVVGVIFGVLAPSAEPKLMTDLPEGTWFDPPVEETARVA